MTTHIVYVISPSRAGASERVKSVERIGNDSSSARIRLTNGKTYDVRFHENRTPEWSAR